MMNFALVFCITNIQQYSHYTFVRKKVNYFENYEPYHSYTSE